MRTTVYLLTRDAEQRAAMRVTLGRHGYRVLAFASVMAFLDHPTYSNLAERSCVVSDMAMPEFSGPEFLGVLEADDAGVPVVFLTDEPDVRIAVESMRFGASYVLQRPFDDRDLLATLMLVIAEFYAPELAHATPPKRATPANVESRVNSLSERERAVLTHVYHGKLNKAIAAELGISVKTVEAHRARMMQKMRAGSLVELIKMTAPYDGLLATVPAGA